MLVAIFFQAEDGIRDHCVTGVQTCALPISSARLSPSTQLAVRYANEPTTPAAYTWRIAGWSRAASVSVSRRNQARPGESRSEERSCRERMQIAGGTEQRRRRKARRTSKAKR